MKVEAALMTPDFTRSGELAAQLEQQGFDCAVITTNHPEFDYEAIATRALRVIDTRNALKGFSGDHIYRL